MTDPEIMDLKASQAGPSLSGLSDAEAAERLRTESYNEPPRTGQRTFTRIVVDVLREPMLAMLIGAGLIYMALGDLQEALILVAFAGLSILITVVQESRTERALDALRDLTSPRALVAGRPCPARRATHIRAGSLPPSGMIAISSSIAITIPRARPVTLAGTTSATLAMDAMSISQPKSSLSTMRKAYPSTSKTAFAATTVPRRNQVMMTGAATMTELGGD